LSFSFLFHGQFDTQEIWRVSNFTQAKFSIKNRVNLKVTPQFYIFFLSCMKRKLVLWYKDRLTVQFVCTEYKVHGSIMTLKVWNLVSYVINWMEKL